MSRHKSIAEKATEGPGTRLRRKHYGAGSIASFLRDVVALANSPAEGPRYLVVGVAVDEAGRRRYRDVPAADFSGDPPYVKLVGEYVEPALRLRYEPATINGVRVGVFEIDACHDQPYMLRVDHCERLRRGDAWAFAGGRATRLGRSQLQRMFEAHFRDAVSADRIEVGFPGDIVHKELDVATIDLEQRPSELARAKLKHVANVKRKSQGTGATTMLARLTHARLFGTEATYEDASPTDLLASGERTGDDYRGHDEHFMFELHGHRLQLVVANHGSEPLTGASLSLAMPTHRALFVADRLPPLVRDGEVVERGMLEADAYPGVVLREDAIRIAIPLGDIAPGAPFAVFDSPPRLAAGSALADRRLALRYTLTASNLRLPVKGKLRIRFCAPASIPSAATLAH